MSNNSNNGHSTIAPGLEMVVYKRPAAFNIELESCSWSNGDVKTGIPWLDKIRAGMAPAIQDAAEIDRIKSKLYADNNARIADHEIRGNATVQTSIRRGLRALADIGKVQGGLSLVQVDTLDRFLDLLEIETEKLDHLVTKRVAHAEQVGRLAA